jgi:hypothetical protein
MALTLPRPPPEINLFSLEKYGEAIFPIGECAQIR